MVKVKYLPQGGGFTYEKGFKEEVRRDRSEPPEIMVSVIYRGADPAQLVIGYVKGSEGYKKLIEGAESGAVKEIHVPESCGGAIDGYLVRTLGKVLRNGIMEEDGKKMVKNAIGICYVFNRFGENTIKSLVGELKNKEQYAKEVSSLLKKYEEMDSNTEMIEI